MGLNHDFFIWVMEVNCIQWKLILCKLMYSMDFNGMSEPMVVCLNLWLTSQRASSYIRDSGDWSMDSSFSLVRRSHGLIWFKHHIQVWCRTWTRKFYQVFTSGPARIHLYNRGISYQFWVCSSHLAWRFEKKLTVYYSILVYSSGKTSDNE